LLYIIFFISPDNVPLYYFLLIAFLAGFLLGIAVFLHIRRAFLLAVGLVLILILGYLRTLNLVTGILLAVFLIILEILFIKS
jgi:hypothetical protein